MYYNFSKLFCIVFFSVDIFFFQIYNYLFQENFLSILQFLLNIYALATKISSTNFIFIKSYSFYKQINKNKLLLVFKLDYSQSFL